MRVSRLTDRVTHQTATTTTNDWGEDIETWADANANVPMQVEVETGDERIRAGRVEATQSARFRYRGSITVEPDDRLVWSGSSWQVQGWPVETSKRPRYMEVLAIRVE